MKSNANDYVIRVLSPLDIDAQAWNALAAQSVGCGPFMRHEYLAAMALSGSATASTGWTARFLTLWQDEHLQAACPLYIKDHSYGEYVFDWAWANAYEQHQLAYYPKALVAVPFTPVPGPRLLARDPATRVALLRALIEWCAKENLSSLHLLFADEADIAACREVGLMLRHTVQFHWTNAGATAAATAAEAEPGAMADTADPTDVGHAPYPDFTAFLAGLSQDKRKKIKQEQRKVAEADVHFRWSHGTDIGAADWDFFYRCYERTYLEHGNAPYLSRDFFQRMADTLPAHWLLFVAEHRGRPIATSLIGLDPIEKVAYGRYWGALERVDCLHFDACYYQPLQWCIAHGYRRFEGGAQGEHKMARALMPVKTTSAHWLAHPSFADAVERFLAREGTGIENYMAHLDARSPYRQRP